MPVTCVFFLGVAKRGASHISTSLELSESSNDTTSTDLCWFCWIEMSCGMSLSGTVLLSELSLEDKPSPHRSAFFDVSTVLDCPGLSEKEVVGVSVSFDCSRGDSTVDRFKSGCSDTGVLAFLFPRSRLVSEGLPNVELNIFCSLLLDAPLKREYKQSKTGQRKG